MPTGLKRLYGNGHLHFITFSCYRRLPLLASEHARNLFVEELAKVRREYGFKLAGYVVMPEHVHLLMSEPERGSPSTVLQMLKQRVSRKMRRLIETSAKERTELPVCGRPEELKAFWQERFYDFNVYTTGKVKEKLNYMHANPVTRGLVQLPGDWPWSSWRFCFAGKECLLDVDSINY